MSTITESDFHKLYQPIQNHLDDNASFDGCMFDTHDDDEVEFVAGIDMRKIWTIVESDNENIAYVAGFHRVNRVGYLVTKSPWKTGLEVVNIEMKDTQ